MRRASRVRESTRRVPGEPAGSTHRGHRHPSAARPSWVRRLHRKTDLNVQTLIGACRKVNRARPCLAGDVRSQPDCPVRRRDSSAGGNIPSRFPNCAASTRTAFHARSARSEEHTSELQSLMRISYAVFCLKKNIKIIFKLKTYY